MHNNQRQTAAVHSLYMNFRSIFIVAIDYKPLEQTYVLYDYISSVYLYNLMLIMPIFKGKDKKELKSKYTIIAKTFPKC